MRAPTPLVLALAASLIVSGCAPDEVEVEEPSSAGKILAATIDPTPPPPDPVNGVRERVRLTDLSVTGSRLYQPGSRADRGHAMDEDAGVTVAEAAAAWLDMHLDSLQFGGDGLVVEARRLVGDRAPFGAGLTDPDRPVAAASYDIQVGMRGGPEWIRVVAEIARVGVATPALVTFVFLPDGDEVVLLAAHAGSGTDVPAAEEEP